MDKEKDYTKEFKDLYLPSNKPMIIDVPEMTFFAVDGKGDPNTSIEYKNAMEILYGLTFTIKMSKMNRTQPEGYFEYKVPPLEGLWWFDVKEMDELGYLEKDKFYWTSMIRQPEFVTMEVFEWAKDILLKKKPEIDLSKAQYKTFTEGTCAQIMHYGPYDNEQESINKLQQFINENGYIVDFSDTRKHHELYINNPQRTKPENLKTVIRYPVKKA